MEELLINYFKSELAKGTRIKTDSHAFRPLYICGQLEVKLGGGVWFRGYPVNCDNLQKLTDLVSFVTKIIKVAYVRELGLKVGDLNQLILNHFHNESQPINPKTFVYVKIDEFDAFKVLLTKNSVLHNRISKPEHDTIYAFRVGFCSAMYCKKAEVISVAERATINFTDFEKLVEHIIY